MITTATPFGIETALVPSERQSISSAWSFLPSAEIELIHDAAVAADELVFRLLAVEGDLRAIQRQMIQLLEHGADGDFQRG